MADNTGESAYIEMTAKIVSAYVGNNPVPSAEIANLISQVHAALKRDVRRAAADDGRTA